MLQKNHFQFEVPGIEDIETIAMFLIDKAKEAFAPTAADFKGAGVAIAMPTDSVERVERKILEAIAA